MDNLKPDKDTIEEFIFNLAKQRWLKRSARYWWPKCLFHFTDIRNVVGILKIGKLLSRNNAEKKGLMATDNASPEVIDGTDDWVKDYVRFYFRPRTPTQYRNEGIRPKSERMLGAHCPVPVFFIFKSMPILTQKGTRFSDGNLGSYHSSIGDSVEFLQNLPFKKIYHSGAYDKNVDSDIKFHRNAEVIVPNEIDLKFLHYIFCRSEAEKETLLNLLPEEIKKKWIRKIIYKPDLALFEKKMDVCRKIPGYGE